MGERREGFTRRADALGIIASAICFVHCVATPVVLSFSAVWAHYLPADEKFHRALAILVAAIGCFAIIKGYIRHQRSRVLLLMIAGLLLIFVGAYSGERLPSHTAEIIVTMSGSCLMISSHLFNHTFCKSCDRCESKEDT